MTNRSVTKEILSNKCFNIDKTLYYYNSCNNEKNNNNYNQLTNKTSQPNENLLFFEKVENVTNSENICKRNLCYLCCSTDDSSSYEVIEFCKSSCDKAFNIIHNK